MTMRQLLVQHWQCANARDWDGFARTLHPEVEYRVPQTRELLCGAAALLDFYRSYPGAWTLELTRLLLDGDQAVSCTAFHVEQQTMTGIAFFQLRDGLVWRIEDWWPESYLPPERMVPMQRY